MVMTKLVKDVGRRLWNFTQTFSWSDVVDNIASNTELHRLVVAYAADAQSAMAFADDSLPMTQTAYGDR